MGGQRDFHWGKSFCPCEKERAHPLADTGVLPDSRPEALALVGIVGIESHFPAGGCRLARLVEALLGGVAAVSMECRRPTGAVLQALAAFPR